MFCLRVNSGCKIDCGSPLVADSAMTVYRRDTIVTRGDAQQKTNKKVLTKGTFERQMAETRKKIKQTITVSFYLIPFQLYQVT